jgi:hypothetical protein
VESEQHSLFPDSVLRHVRVGINGINVPWMYHGCLYSTFCWHKSKITTTLRRRLSPQRCPGTAVRNPRREGGCRRFGEGAHAIPIDEDAGCSRSLTSYHNYVQTPRFATKTTEYLSTKLSGVLASSVITFTLWLSAVVSRWVQMWAKL